MIYDDEWADETDMHRLEAIRETLHQVTLDELVKLGEKRFPVVTDPWYEDYSQLLKGHPHSRFYMARFFQEDSEEYVELVYCSETNSGMWFLPGKGMGVLQQEVLSRLAVLVERM